ncbi:MAG: hypothetical protein MN733_17185, partial [Nitrososphaera sp.]|nr:hypothetical protein [Nitrososphaera sp.]
ALMKQVASNDAVVTIEMTPEEEAAFIAQQLLDQAASDAQAARAALLLEKHTLKEKINDAIISGDPPDPADVTRYRDLKAII